MIIVQYPFSSSSTWKCIRSVVCTYVNIEFCRWLQLTSHKKMRYIYMDGKIISCHISIYCTKRVRWFVNIHIYTYTHTFHTSVVFLSRRIMPSIYVSHCSKLLWRIIMFDDESFNARLNDFIIIAIIFHIKQ
jgi:hypothetical protein